MQRPKIGDHVKVIGFKRSAHRYGFATRMDKMVGKVYTVDSVDNNDIGCVLINGIYMSTKDIANLTNPEIKPEIKPEPQIFLYDSTTIDN
jgi:hypothetical protein